jgi:protein involved in polysaccharide export with SLBB domain
MIPTSKPSLDRTCLAQRAAANNNDLMTMNRFHRVAVWSLLLCALAFLAGCQTNSASSSGQHFASTNLPPAGGGARTNVHDSSFSILRVGDLIMINFSDVERPPQKQEVNIPDGGMITLPFNVHIKADGKTTTQLEKDIRDAYVPSLFVNLTVTVKADQRYYFVDGEVKLAKSWPYFGETTVLRAIANAGGFTEFADKRNIELRRHGGQRFFINYNKALKDEKLDLPVFPNDHIIVPKSFF